MSELCNSVDGACDNQDLCKVGWHGVKCDKGTCIILFKYSWKSGKCINKFKKEKRCKGQVKYAIRKSTLQMHIYMFSHSYDLDTSTKSKDFI